MCGYAGHPITGSVKTVPQPLIHLPGPETNKPMIGSQLDTSQLISEPISFKFSKVQCLPRECSIIVTSSSRGERERECNESVCRGCVLVKERKTGEKNEGKKKVVLTDYDLSNKSLERVFSI